MKDKWLLDKLYCYDLRNSSESSVSHRMIEFVLANGIRCFDRELSSGHIVGSAWIVNEGRSHALLVWHAKLGRWLQCGGHVERVDANVLAAALREAIEESGLPNLTPVSDQIFDIDIHAIPGRGNQPAHLHYDVRFAFVASHRAFIALSMESHGTRWMSLHDILQDASVAPSMSRMAQKTIDTIQ
jgi:8-oxo-dGTP pyrophosphatase MutT (NUDIX family)